MEEDLTSLSNSYRDIVKKVTEMAKEHMKDEKLFKDLEKRAQMLENNIIIEIGASIAHIHETKNHLQEVCKYTLIQDQTSVKEI